MQDDWAHGVDISGLDEKTVRQLIYQVNLEFGDPPTPEPEISWRDYERVPHRKRGHILGCHFFLCLWVQSGKTNIAELRKEVRSTGSICGA